MINNYLECPTLQSDKPKELDQEVDLDAVTAFLTGDVETKWPGSCGFPSAKLTVKFSILHKIDLAVCLPNTRAMNVSVDLAVLLYSIGTGLPLDMGKHIFELIVNHAESKTTYGKLPFPISHLRGSIAAEYSQGRFRSFGECQVQSRFVKSCLQANMW